jgi:hypothetical protein
MSRRLGDAPGHQCVDHRRGEADALEGVPRLQLAVGGDGCLDLRVELPVERRHHRCRALQARADGLERGGVGGCRRDPLGQQFAECRLPGDQQLTLVGEVPEERALGDARALRDLGDGRRVVALLGEQVDGGHDHPLPRSWFPPRHGTIIGDGTFVP